MQRVHRGIGSFSVGKADGTATPSRRAASLCRTLGLAALTAALLALAVPTSEAGAGGFRRGEARAQANAVTLALQPGGTPVNIRYGTSLANYQNTAAASQGKALDMGLLEILLGETGACEGTSPLLPDEIMPVTTTASSSERTGIETKPVEVQLPNPPDRLGPVIGTQYAGASESPLSSNARTTTVDQYLGIFDVIEPWTDVSTRLEGTVREAHATMGAKRISILGGLIEIFQPRWNATARSGSIAEESGSFTFTRATVWGFDRPAASFQHDFEGFADGISSTLGFLGAELNYPTVTVDDGEVSVSELVLKIKNPPIGTDLLTPLLDAFEPTLSAGRQNLIDQDCNNAGILQILDLVLGVFAGVGEIRLGIGGVSAFTADTAFPEPFVLGVGSAGPPTAAITGPAPALAAPREDVDEFASVDMSPVQDLGSSFDADLDHSDITSDGGAVLDDPLEEPPAPDPDSEPDERSGETLAVPISYPQSLASSSRYEDGDSSRPALIVGLGGLVLALALWSADRNLAKRSQRRIPS